MHITDSRTANRCYASINRTINYYYSVIYNIYLKLCYYTLLALTPLWFTTFNATASWKFKISYLHL